MAEVTGELIFSYTKGATILNQSKFVKLCNCKKRLHVL